MNMVPLKRNFFGFQTGAAGIALLELESYSSSSFTSLIP
jgi:hypothetical protein